MSEEKRKRRAEQQRKIAAMVAAHYGQTTLCKVPCHTSIRTGKIYMEELRDGSARHFLRETRMNERTFDSILQTLTTRGSLTPTHHIDVDEQLAIFLHVVGQGASSANTQELFQHSGETISRYFHIVLDGLAALATDVITLPSHQTHPKILSNPKFSPFFNACRMAVDGTHVPAVIPAQSRRPFRNRKGTLTQNVLAACDFNLRFTFVLAGWEGSAGDGALLLDALGKGYTIEQGRFDIGDAGFGLKTWMLTPYRGVRYHLREWAAVGERPATPKELYNLRHSSLRNVIERAFGVLKKRFPILTRASIGCSFDTQVKMVLATCVLHNLIRDLNGDDDEIQIEADRELAGQSPRTEDQSPATEDNEEAVVLRDRVAEQMWTQYQAYLAQRTRRRVVEVSESSGDEEE